VLGSVQAMTWLLAGTNPGDHGPSLPRVTTERTGAMVPNRRGQLSRVRARRRGDEW